MLLPAKSLDGAKSSGHAQVLGELAQLCGAPGSREHKRGLGEPHADLPWSLVHPWIAASNLGKTAKERSCICPNRQI